MSKSIQSPLARLVIVCLCLALIGGLTGGLHYYAVDLPQQQVQQAPTNCAFPFGSTLTTVINGEAVDVWCIYTCCTSIDQFLPVHHYSSTDGFQL